MYKAHFGLSERPFSIAPDPQFLYMSRQHKEAMAHLSYGVQQGGGFILLTGEVGTGKTTLCRNLLKRLPDDVDVALILNAAAQEDELLQSIADELNIAYEKNDSQKTLLNRLNQYLLESFSNKRKTVLIIDEAQLLSRDVLEQVRLLTNLETTKNKLLQIILIGQPELNDVLKRQDLRQLAQRVTARYHLNSIQREDMTDYVTYRLKIAGCTVPIFTRQALNKIFRLTKGIPRLINVLCDHALIAAYSKDSHLVDTKIVKQAAQDMLLLEDSSTSTALFFGRYAKPALLALGAVVLGGAVLWGVSSGAPKWFSMQPAAPDVTTTQVTVIESDKANAAKPVVVAPTDAQAESFIHVDKNADNVADEEVDGIVADGFNVNDRAESTNATATDSAALVVDLANVEAGDLGLESVESASVEAESITTELAELNAVTSAGLDQGSVPQLNDVLSDEGGQASERVRILPLSAMLEDVQAETARIQAFRQLAFIWDRPLPDIMLNDFCVEVRNLKLDCLTGENDPLDAVAAYNRPVILVLENNTGLHRVILRGLGQNAAQVQFGDDVVQVPRAQLESLWTGRYLLYWQPPAVGYRLFQQGNSGSKVVWLRQQIHYALLQTGQDGLADTVTQTYDAQLTSVVQDIQRAAGIIADGQVGVQTFMQINKMLGRQNVPTLTMLDAPSSLSAAQ